MATVKANIEVKSNEEIVTTYRIVNTDNFGGDYHDEFFTAIDISSESVAEVIAKNLNDLAGEHATRYYNVVRHIEIKYRLQPGFQP